MYPVSMITSTITNVYVCLKYHVDILKPYILSQESKSNTGLGLLVIRYAAIGVLHLVTLVTDNSWLFTPLYIQNPGKPTLSFVQC